MSLSNFFGFVLLQFLANRPQTELGELKWVQKECCREVNQPQLGACQTLPALLDYCSVFSLNTVSLWYFECHYVTIWETLTPKSLLLNVSNWEYLRFSVPKLHEMICPAGDLVKRFSDSKHECCLFTQELFSPHCANTCLMHCVPSFYTVSYSNQWFAKLQPALLLRAGCWRWEVIPLCVDEKLCYNEAINGSE